MQSPAPHRVTLEKTKVQALEQGLLKEIMG